jgi:tRNA/tmRNA/rRNA uracil-C5-methylase (TrmA/RlmC/RlmD family)
MKIHELEGDVHFLPLRYEKEFTKFVKNQRGKTMQSMWQEVLLRSRKGAVKKTVPFGDCPYFVPEILIVSEKLKALIQGFTQDPLEFLPVVLDGQSGYSYMNVLCMLDALDLEKTELKRFEDGKIMYVIQAQYHEAVIHGHHIFILPNYHGIFITEELKTYLENNGVQGATYRDTTERVENPLAEVFNKPKKAKPKPVVLH